MVASRAANGTTTSIDRNSVCWTQSCLLNTPRDLVLRVKWLFGRLFFDEFNLYLLTLELRNGREGRKEEDIHPKITPFP